MIKNFLARMNFQKNKKIILGGLVLILVLIWGVSAVLFSGSSISPEVVQKITKKKMARTIPAMGYLPALDVAMDQNRALRRKVSALLAYDENHLFVNYPQVNAQITEIMFLWIGLTAEQVEEKGKQKAAEYFIRRLYNLPPDEPIKNNPLLEKYPWAGLFQKIKSKLLMLGQGHKIYKGVAYYDSERDKMVIEGELSQEFAEALAAFIKALPKEKQRAYRNNYLMFIDKTLGLENLSDKEKSFLKNAGFL